MSCSLRLDSIYGRVQSIQNPALLSSLLEALRSRDTVTLLVLCHIPLSRDHVSSLRLYADLLNVIWHCVQEVQSEPETIKLS